ncbi:MAG: c-type cytochrome [Gammaproteobacteria bacterium]|nr:c-type cytochrome [Gammaproteobacteria bacterium]MDH5593739.1 c-type cytochrome [Gammaproteobacteria bacterium]MDH5614541.1 c-type cytochrome [Gammaproteobacteria bacterium]
MKIKNLIYYSVGITLVAASMVTHAADRKIETAPPEFLKMSNPNDVDDVDKKIMKNAKKLYKMKCKKCHGSDGDGKGSAADDMEVKPTAFNKPGYLKTRKDGQLFWILKKGSKGSEMEGFGPGTDANLSDEEMWGIITYMRSEFTK